MNSEFNNNWDTIKEATALIVGVGGLGSFVAMELTRLGFRKLILVDPDRVSKENLTRQILYSRRDIGSSKVTVAKKVLKEINPNIEIEIVNGTFNKINANALVRKTDLVFDCSDNFETKILLNRVCFYNKRPLISAGVYVWEGWVTTFPFYREDIDQYPCLECLFGELKKEERKNGKVIEDIFYSALLILFTKCR